MKNYRNFSSESFHVLVVKFSIYLNRRVFEMVKGWELITCRTTYHSESSFGNFRGTLIRQLLSTENLQLKELKSITKTRLFKYCDNLTTKIEIFQIKTLIFSIFLLKT